MSTNSSSQFAYSNYHLVNLKDCVPDFYVECITALWIWRTIPFVLVLIGTCGNILNIIILSRLRKYSTSVFLIMLAVAELLSLWVTVVPVTIYALTSIFIDDLVELMCRLREWITYTSGAFSLWVLVLLNIERIVRIKTPIFARNKLTPRNTFIIGCVTLIVIATLNAHIIFGLTLEANSDPVTSESKRCSFISENYKRFSERIWSVIIFVVYALLPAGVILIGNINIASALILRRKRMNVVHPHNVHRESKNGSRKSTTLLLFIICSFFFVTTIPFCVYLIVKGNTNDFKGRSLARWQLAHCITSALIFSNFSFNFFFYFVSGTLFKQEWNRLVMKTKQKFKNITRSF